MPQGLGFYSGQLEADKTLRQLSVLERNASTNEQELALRRQQEQRQMQDSQTSNLLRMAQREQLARQFQEEDQTKQLLSKAFSANTPIVNSANAADGQSQVGEQAISAGQKLLAVNPKVGLELIKSGQQQKTQADVERLRNMQFTAARAEQSGQVMGTINDQASLDEALPELSKMGVNVPERFRTWGPEAQRYFQNRAIASDNYLKSVQISNQAKQIDLQEQENKSKQQDRLAKQKLTAQKEVRLQEKVTASRKLKPPTPVQLKSELAGLKEIPEFDDLSKGELMDAANDVIGLAQSYLSDGTAENQSVAMARAREEIRKRIDPESGKYNRISTNTQVPSMDEWLAKAKQANPNATDEQLEAYYTNKYGNK